MVIFCKLYSIRGIKAEFNMIGRFRHILPAGTQQSTANTTQVDAIDTKPTIAGRQQQQRITVSAGKLHSLYIVSKSVNSKEPNRIALEYVQFQLK